MVEYRCDCGKLLFKLIMDISSLEIKCPRCKNLCRKDLIYKANNLKALTNVKVKTVHGKVSGLIGRKNEESII